MLRTKKVRTILIVAFLAFCSMSIAVESGVYRLLSLSESEKLILVSHVPSKTKYLLDASTAKITLNGKPAEFKELKVFATVQVKVSLKKFSKKGIDLDGSASEIKITGPEK